MKKDAQQSSTKKYALFALGTLFIALGIFIYVKKRIPFVSPQFLAESETTVTAQFVSSTITADGSVTAQNQAKLNFLTAGKLVRLPFKEGDTVLQGQTVAQLDTYALQRQLTAALNTYRATRDTFDQVQQNAQNNQLQASQYSSYTSVQMDKTMAINDAVKRIADQNQASLDNSVINVELANYALQLSTLTSPINGIITHEDVTVPGINITSTTSFTVSDPDSMVFRANVPAEHIYYITPGSAVSLAIDGIQDKINGTVVKIYPSKVTLASGQSVYQVDVASPLLKQFAKFDMSGRASISTNANNIALVPAWTVLGGKYIWIDNNGTPELKEVKVGKIHGTQIEVTHGLTPSDKILINPKYIPSLQYQLL